MPLRVRLAALTPLAVLVLATTGAAVVGLRSSAEPRITAAQWPDAVHQLLSAPGVRFSYVLRTEECEPTGPGCAKTFRSARETGVLAFSPTRYDSVYRLEHLPGGKRPAFERIKMRGSGGREYQYLERCWTQGSLSVSSVPEVTALLAVRDPAVAAPAAPVLELLGLPELLWTDFSPELREALRTAEFPVTWRTDDGDLVIHLDGREVAERLAVTHPAESLALSRIAAASAEWRATPLDAAPTVRGPGATCID